MSESLMGLKMNPGLQEAYNKATATGLRLTSSFRPGSVGPSGKADSHSKGMAMDFAGSGAAMGMFAEWAKKSGLFTEVLYQTAGHYDHVHVGWEQGKHQAGKIYVGDHTLIDQVKTALDTGDFQTVGGKAGSGAASGGDKAGVATSIFGGIIRTVLAVLCVGIAVYFFIRAFPNLKINI
ncbi:hypothetical protein CON65_12625 [Bacillus pseudomycoides]|uniref:Peptidase M15 n=1 Tax=Bacillus pseudomycoides TaxID=64104 RepID=A0AA91VBT6_9BACI|nr:MULTISPECIES: hypothetical protein [Bacillus]PED82322.1 hypothetical protein CON65_12625 [Bacillus pseudomycoides]PFW63032.1 hypothetical protein COL20_10450 [Bacillus sp. AFS075034]